MSIKNILSICILILLLNAAHGQSYLNQTVQYDGQTRAYSIYVPAIYDGTQPVPLVFSFHGGGGSIAGNIAINDFSSVADTANFIAVYPQALADPNDDGNTLWIQKDPTTVDDVLFINALIDSIATDYQIDQSRIYACGYSHGGEFTLSLGCRLNSRIAAIGVVARTMQTYTYNNCTLSHPTGIITILGTNDDISNYNGVFWEGTQLYLSAAEMHGFWAEQNNCNTTATVSNVPNVNTTDGSTVERHAWSTNAGCTYVEELKVIGGGHDWPGSFGNMDISATQEIWQFVSRYSINGLISCLSTSTNDHLHNKFQFQVYPNPAEDVITIENNFSETMDFTIFSPLGNTVLSGQVDANLSTINVSALPPNIYFLEIEKQTIKFIKVK